MKCEIMIGGTLQGCISRLKRLKYRHDDKWASRLLGQVVVQDIFKRVLTWHPPIGSFRIEFYGM